MTEATVLVMVGMGAAVMLAIWCVPSLVALAPDTVPRLNDVTLRTPALIGFALGTGVIAALACGLLPVVIVLNRMPGLLTSAQTTSSTTTLPVRSGLLALQTALAVLLLVAATLTVRSFHAIQGVQLGFDPGELWTFDVLAPSGKYERRGANNRFYREAIEHVRRLPDVSAVSAIYLRPFEFGPIGSGAAIIREGQSPEDREAWRSNPTLNAEAVTPDYFKVMGIPLLQGRTFTDQDTENAAPVIIVSHSAATRLWPGQNPIGKRLIASYDTPKNYWQTVVGVVGDARYRGLTETTFDLYKPFLQSEDHVKHFIVRGSGDGSAFVGQLRSAIRAVDSQAVVDAIRPMRAVVDRELAPWRFVALLFSLLALLAVIVAVVGLYALLAHKVTDRTREIGIRMALGAHHQQIVRFFAFDTARVIGTGLLLGLIAASLVSRSMTALLFGVTPADPSTYATVCVLLLLSATAGAYWPIRRATSVDPILALRRE